MKYLTVMVVSSLLLVASIASLPYGFYTFLRFIVFLFSLYSTYLLIEIYEKKISIYVIPISVAIVYNPLIRIHLDKDTWSVVNLVTIVLLWYPYSFKKFREKIE